MTPVPTNFLKNMYENEKKKVDSTQLISDGVTARVDSNVLPKIAQDLKRKNSTITSDDFYEASKET
jgi:hypothetical protein